MAMSKSSLSVLAKAISSKNGLTPAEAERFIQKMFEVANTAIEEEKQLKVRWLGTFKVTSVKDRESVDVNTGDRIVIEGRNKISFTPDNILKEIINKPFAQFETVVVNDGVDFSDIDEKFAKMEEEEQAETPQNETITFQEEETVPEQAELVDDSDAPIAAPDADTDTAASDTDTVAAVAVADTSVDVETKGVSSVETSAEDLVAKIEDSVADENLAEEKPEEDIASENTAIPESLQVNEESSETSVAEEQISKKINAEEQNAEEKNEEHLVVEPSAENVQTEDVEQSASIESTASVSSIPHVGTTSPESTTPPASSAASVTEAVDTSHYEIEEDDDEDTSDRHHFVIPKYLVAIVCLAFIALLGGMGWFAFNYGKMQAQRDHLATQLEGMKTQAATKAKVKKVAPAPVKVDSAQLAMNEKARQDSIRMAAASQAIEKAEASQKAEELERVEAAKASKAENVANATQAKASKAELQKASDAAKSSHYDNDPRVRTGAYRIVGVAQVVTVKAGQTLAGLSKTYLGPGMECYIEALNGASEVKAGQKLKIPKLELKKKK